MCLPMQYQSLEVTYSEAFGQVCHVCTAIIHVFFIHFFTLPPTSFLFQKVKACKHSEGHESYDI